MHTSINTPTEGHKYAHKQKYSHANCINAARKWHKYAQEIKPKFTK